MRARVGSGGVFVSMGAVRSNPPVIPLLTVLVFNSLQRQGYGWNRRHWDPLHVLCCISECHWWLWAPARVVANSRP